MYVAIFTLVRHTVHKLKISLSLETKLQEYLFSISLDDEFVPNVTNHKPEFEFYRSHLRVADKLLLIHGGAYPFRYFYCWIAQETKNEEWEKNVNSAHVGCPQIPKHYRRRNNTRNCGAVSAVIFLSYSIKIFWYFIFISCYICCLTTYQIRRKRTIMARIIAVKMTAHPIKTDCITIILLEVALGP